MPCPCTASPNRIRKPRSSIPLDRSLRHKRRKLGTLRNHMADLNRGAPSDTAVQRMERLRPGSRARDPEASAQAHQGRRSRQEPDPRHSAHDRLPRRDPDDARRRRTQGKTLCPRQRPRALFRSDADIIPDHHRWILRVRMLCTACNATTAGPLREFNGTHTHFPGTQLRMVYELPPNHIRSRTILYLKLTDLIY